MTHRTISRLLSTGVVVLALGAGSAARAQSFAAYTAAKRAATRAAAATDAHTRAEQNTSTVTPAPASATTSTARTTHAARAAAPAAAKAPAAIANVPAADDRTGDPRKGSQSSSVTERAGPGQISIMREVFTYRAEGRRDPFVSLIKSGELRPMISDLRLVTVIYAAGGRSVAILRDVSTNEQYRVRVGQTLGRMRVARIEQKSVVFIIEEFGYSRQEALALNDSTNARSQ